MIGGSNGAAGKEGGGLTAIGRADEEVEGEGRVRVAGGLLDVQPEGTAIAQP